MDLQFRLPVRLDWVVAVPVNRAKPSALNARWSARVSIGRLMRVKGDRGFGAGCRRENGGLNVCDEDRLRTVAGRPDFDRPRLAPYAKPRPANGGGLLSDGKSGLHPLFEVCSIIVVDIAQEDVLPGC